MPINLWQVSGKKRTEIKIRAAKGSETETWLFSERNDKISPLIRAIQ